jgi:hypothetical protein
MNNQWPDKLAPHNIQYVLEGLEEGDTLSLTRKNGSIDITIKSAGKRIASLGNRLSYTLKPQPVAPGWMGRLEEDCGVGAQFRKTHRKELSKKVREHKTARNYLRAAFLLELSSMNISDGTLYTTSSATYLVFNVGNYLVYTQHGKTPMMYRESAQGEYIYL